MDEQVEGRRKADCVWQRTKELAQKLFFNCRPAAFLFDTAPSLIRNRSKPKFSFFLSASLGQTDAESIVEITTNCVGHYQRCNIQVCSRRATPLEWIFCDLGWLADSQWARLAAARRPPSQYLQLAPLAPRFITGHDNKNAICWALLAIDVT